MTLTEIIRLVQPVEFAFVFFAVIYVLVYWSNISKRFNEIVSPQRVIYVFITSLVIVAIGKTVLQYMTWSNDGFTKLLLPPYQSWEYFVIYAGGRFWLAPILGIVSAVLFYSVLRTYMRMRKVEIANNHLLIGCMMALLVSWPRFVFFVPFVLTLAVVFTILNIFIFKRDSVPLLPAFILGGIFTLIYGTGILNAIGLSVLTV